MKIILIILIWFLLYLFLPLPLISRMSLFDRVIFYWLWFNLLVCLYEIVVVIKAIKGRKQVDSYTLSTDLSFTKSLTPNFWDDLWLDLYGQFDPRYREIRGPTSQDYNPVYFFELGNLLVSFLPSLLLLNYLLSNEKNKIERKYYRSMAIAMSFFQLILTIGYYLSAFASSSKRNSFYGLLALPWIIFPLLTIYWGSLLL